MGSFYALVAYRLPRGKSVVLPSSECPKCAHRLLRRDLIPLLSYVMLQGRCRMCGQPISPRYPVMELLTGILFGLAYHWSESGPQLVAGLVLVSFLLILSFIDAEHMILPDRLTLSGAGVGLFCSFLGWTGISWGYSFLGWIVAVAVLGVVSILSRGGMGGGDVKLLGMIGTFIGPADAVIALFAASFFGVVAAFILIALGRRTRHDPLPFGPFLALAATSLWFLPSHVSFGIIPFFY